MGSVGVAILQTNAAQNQVEIAKEQNSELRDQFMRAGPIVTVSSQLQLRDKPATGSPPNTVRTYDDLEAPVVSAAVIDKSDLVYFNVELANAGRSTTTIQSVDLKIGPNVYRLARAKSPNWVIYCGPAPLRSKDCVDELPYSLEPGKVYRVFFPIFPGVHKTIVNNNVGSEGLEVRIYAVGIQQQPLKYVSHVRLTK